VYNDFVMVTFLAGHMSSHEPGNLVIERARWKIIEMKFSVAESHDDNWSESLAIDCLFQVTPGGFLFHVTCNK